MERWQKDLPVKMSLFKSALVLLASTAILGCRREATKSEDECVENLRVLSLAATSYALDNALSNSTIVNPSGLVGFLKQGQVPKCPLGNAPYEPFALNSGPVCPNSSVHTERFREKEAKK